MMPSNVNFCCANCLKICNWNSREPVPLDGRIHEYKTIGGMYCNAEECIQAEEKAHGITRDKMPWRVVFETPADGDEKER